MQVSDPTHCVCCCSCCILHEIWKKNHRVYLGCIAWSSPASLGCPNELRREQILMRIPTWLSATCPFGWWPWGLSLTYCPCSTLQPPPVSWPLWHMSVPAWGAWTPALGCLPALSQQPWDAEAKPVFLVQHPMLCQLHSLIAVIITRHLSDLPNGCL